LYIDDGSGYEERSEGIALEPLMDQAVGGERYFQVTAAKPVTKAHLITTATAPFTLVAGSKLAVSVGGSVTEHTFNSADFRSIGSASAYEVVSSINANSLLGFSARTSDAGTKVAIFSKEDALEDIEVTSGEANDVLLLPSGRVDTLRLYKNDRLLYKDGRVASLESLPFANWGSFVAGETLVVAVDGTPAITYTFADQDFVNAKTGYTTVGRNSLAAWVAVLNAKIPGIAATAASGALVLTSNAGAVSRAALSIDPASTLITKQMFQATGVVGLGRDYTLDRNTGQLRLEVPLVAGDRLSAGSQSTRAFIESASLPATTLGGSGGKLWFSVDGSAALVSTGINSAVPMKSVVQSLKGWGMRVRLSAVAGSAIFTNVRDGDWMVAWDTGAPAALRGLWRVAQTDKSTWVEVDRRSMVAGRNRHSMVTLADNKILVVGGYGMGGIPLASCSVYDPATDTWTAKASMATARTNAQAVLLANGKILVVGGTGLDGLETASCELYDPTANTWSGTGALPAARAYGRAVLLSASGDVLFIAGTDASNTAVNTAYRYSVGAGTWSSTGSLSTARHSFSAVVLADGRVLVTGGYVASVPTTSCEVYDPTATTWASAGAMGTARADHRSGLYADGTKVLVSGGIGTGGSSIANCDLYTVAGGTWAATGSLSQARGRHTLTRLPSGDFLASFGGSGVGGNTPTATAEIFSISGGTWSAAAAPLATARIEHQALLLSTNKVLVAGGHTGSTWHADATAELYDPTGLSWSASNNAVASTSFTVTSNGIVFVRASSALQALTVPAASNYLASSVASSVNAQLVGGAASVYRTDKLRVATNSFGTGSLGLITADTEGQKLLLTASDAVANTGSHLGYVESGNGEAGTPEFKTLELVSSESTTSIEVYGQALTSQLVMQTLAPFNDDMTVPTPVSRHGNGRYLRSAIQAITGTGTAETKLALRSGVAQEWYSQDRLYASSPFAMGPSDSLTVVADNDQVTHRYPVAMYRRLQPVGTTYGTTNTFRDLEQPGRRGAPSP
jgi:hypothetical protein